MPLEEPQRKDLQHRRWLSCDSDRRKHSFISRLTSPDRTIRLRGGASSSGTLRATCLDRTISGATFTAARRK